LEVFLRKKSKTLNELTAYFMAAGGYSHGPFILGIVAILQQDRPTAPLWREVQQRCRLLRFSVSIAK
jgi:hypothetical protein